ncbi:MAG: peptidoglycan-binding domain-containing protein [Candidatus Gracilibacteria bacterium]
MFLLFVRNELAIEGGSDKVAIDADENGLTIDDLIDFALSDNRIDKKELIEIQDRYNGEKEQIGNLTGEKIEEFMHDMYIEMLKDGINIKNEQELYDVLSRLEEVGIEIDKKIINSWKAEVKRPFYKLTSIAGEVKNGKFRSNLLDYSINNDYISSREIKSKGYNKEFLDGAIKNDAESAKKVLEQLDEKQKEALSVLITAVNTMWDADSQNTIEAKSILEKGESNITKTDFTILLELVEKNHNEKAAQVNPVVAGPIESSEKSSLSNEKMGELRLLRKAIEGSWPDEPLKRAVMKIFVKGDSSLTKEDYTDIKDLVEMYEKKQAAKSITHVASKVVEKKPEQSEGKVLYLKKPVIPQPEKTPITQEKINNKLSVVNGYINADKLDAFVKNMDKQSAYDYFNMKPETERKEIQRLLGVKDDGIIGPNTLKEIVRFQALNGLEQDGKVGPLTLTKLKEAVNVPVPEIQETDITESVSEKYTQVKEWIKELFRDEKDIDSFTGKNGKKVIIEFDDENDKFSLDTSVFDNVFDLDFDLSEMSEDINSIEDARTHITDDVKKDLKEQYDNKVVENAIKSAKEHKTQTISSFKPDGETLETLLTGRFDVEGNYEGVSVTVNTTYSDRVLDSDVSVKIDGEVTQKQVYEAVKKVETDYVRLYNEEKEKAKIDGSEEGQYL